MSVLFGLLQTPQTAGCGKKVVLWIFSIDARFQSVAGDRQLLLTLGQRVAVGYLKLPCHQVSPCDHFRYRMFYLKARVHLHKVEAAAGV